MDYFINRYKWFQLRVSMGRLCLSIKWVVLNDISDGLVSELNEIVEVSCVLIEIDESMFLVYFDLFKFYFNWKEWVLFGGEDFELIGMVLKEEWEVLKQECEIC